MKIVFLDAKTVGEDIDLSQFSTVGEFITYDYSTEEEAAERTKDADIIIVNKVDINEQTIGEAKNLKLVCQAATGTDNLDKDYLAKRGIIWKNAVGYSTNAVAQHTIAMVLYLLEKLKHYDDYVKDGTYSNGEGFTYFAETFTEIAGKTWGIIGLGAIGRKVADIAKAFGARVIYYSASGSPAQPGYEQVDLDTLLKESDFLTVHAPLNEYTRAFVNKDVLSKMKSNAIFINVGRGPIVVEEDLAEALENGTIAAAGLDVLVDEPLSIDNPLMKIQDSRKLIITPHMAWASLEARKNLMDIMFQHILDFMA